MSRLSLHIVIYSILLIQLCFIKGFSYILNRRDGYHMNKVWTRACLPITSKFHSLYESSLASINASSVLYPIPSASEFSKKSGFLRKEDIQFSCHSFESDLMRQLRIVSVHGSGYDVFNLVGILRTASIPIILGLDLVVYADVALAAIDFQPIGDLDYPSLSFYRKLGPVHDRWKASLMGSQSLPEKFSNYFSPYCLFARRANDIQSLSLIEAAAMDYVQVYSDMLRDVSESTTLHSSSFNETHEVDLKRYLDFRIENDPAKNILNVAFGKDWTERALREAVFPYIHPNSAQINAS